MSGFLLGLLSFVATFFFIILVHELGHFLAARRAGVVVEEFGVGFPPRLWATKRGGTEYSLNLIPLGGFVRLLGEEDPQAPGSLAERRPSVRLFILAAGSVSNLLLPLMLLPLSFMLPRPVLLGGEGIRVVQVVRDSPAAQAGLQAEDVILAVDGRPTSGLAQLEDLSQLISARAGAPMTLLLEREGQTSSVTVVPRVDTPSGQGRLGIVFTWARPLIETRAYLPWEAVPLGIAETWNLVSLTFRGLATMVAGQSPLAVVGVVGIAQATGEVSQGGIVPLVVWTAMLSLNIGILNLLPIPMLDGGRMAFVLIEVLRRGKRISPQKERLAHMIGLALLLALVAVVSYYDIVRLVQGRSIIP
ncbi:MAG: site-2 protease family protein [Chloroflexi bacterium]|nr:site-2 protease family protein [Chloroflexota bacterium]